MIEVSGLQSAPLARQLAGGGRDAIRPEAVDDLAIPGPPQSLAQREGVLHEEAIIQLVEIPFVEQELVQPAVLHRQSRRKVRLDRITHIRGHDSEAAGDQWQELNDA